MSEPSPSAVPPRPARRADRPRRRPAGGTDDVWSYIVKRTQIYLDEGQDRRLAERAAVQGVTKSEIIRAAVDRYLDHDDQGRRLEAFRAAVRATSGGADMDVDAIDRLRGGGADRLAQLHPD